MTTISQVAKQTVLANIDNEYIVECGHSTLREVYQAEYGYNGITPQACKDYLQGLPSVCTVPFCNSEILDLLEKNHITSPTKKGREKLIESYWAVIGSEFYNLIRKVK